MALTIGWRNKEEKQLALADYKVVYPDGRVRHKRLNDDDAKELKERLGKEGKVEKARNR